MERLIPLVVLLWCGAGPALSAAEPPEPIAPATRRQEPALLVALPLHRPVPVLQLVSAAGPSAPPRAPPARPGDTPPAVAESQTYYSRAKPLHYKTTSTWYGNKQQSQTSSWYEEPSAADATPAGYGQRLRARRPSSAAVAGPGPAGGREEQSAPQDAADYYEPPAEQQVNSPVVLYARPTEQGGYTYRRRPAKPPKKAEPIIIRIHRHRIIRDD